MAFVKPVGAIEFPECPGTCSTRYLNAPRMCARGNKTSTSITTTLHQIGCLVSRNCTWERSGGKLSCKLAYIREGTPKSPITPTVVVILEE